MSLHSNSVLINTKEILDHIICLRHEDFICWSEDALNGYNTALTTIEKFIARRQLPEISKEPEKSEWTCRVCGAHKYHEHITRTEYAIVYNYVCDGCSVVMRDPDKFSVTKKPLYFKTGEV